MLNIVNNKIENMSKAKENNLGSNSLSSAVFRYILGITKIKTAKNIIIGKAVFVLVGLFFLLIIIICYIAFKK